MNDIRVEHGAHFVEISPGKFVSAGKAKSLDRGVRLCSDNQEPIKGSALVSPASGENSSWYGSAKRFQITFRVYAIRPPDWDGCEIKQLQDMVVHAGILPDDNWRILQGRVVTEKAHSKEEERTEIEIVTL